MLYAAKIQFSISNLVYNPCSYPKSSVPVCVTSVPVSDAVLQSLMRIPADVSSVLSGMSWVNAAATLWTDCFRHCCLASC